MYFPFLNLHGWGKSLAIRPQTIDSEVPENNVIPVFPLRGFFVRNEKFQKWVVTCDKMM